MLDFVGVENPNHTSTSDLMLDVEQVLYKVYS